MHDRIDLARYRFSCAEECLQNAKDLLALGNQGLKASANRSYYAFFHAMRAVLALEGKDFKKHSALISYFRQQYMQPGVFPASCSKALTKIFRRLYPDREWKGDISQAHCPYGRPPDVPAQRPA